MVNQQPSSSVVIVVFRSFCHSNPSRSTTVGILAHQDKKAIVILQTIGENSVADAVKINRGSIVKIETISRLKIKLD
jgi:hypothetical protein